MKKIIIIPDSFKGSLSSLEVCNAIEEGILKVFKNIEIKKIPIADGGEGTVDSVLYATGGKIKKVNVRNPLGEIIKAKYGIIDKNGWIFNFDIANIIIIIQMIKAIIDEIPCIFNSLIF